MKIVSLCHYPISTPLHGGQRRVAAIAQEARTAGHDFHVIPIFVGSSYPHASEQELTTSLPTDFIARVAAEGLREDLHLSRLLGPDHPLVSRAAHRLRAMAPDVIQFDHPWLYPLFRDLLRAGADRLTAQLVYSAHNVEADLITPAFREETQALERQLVREADTVVAVSAADAAVFDDWRQPGQARTIVAPNGCWAPDLSDNNAPAPVVSGEYALIAGSAHPPNARGYWECIGPVPGFLPPGTRLVVAGGMSDLLGADPRYGRFPLTNQEFVVHTGVVSEDVLTALLFHAKVICLPITDGGGTNLKTAEALMWLKPVVAMPMAMRGFEEARSLSGVFVADTPAQFRTLLREAMTGRLGSARRAEDVARYGWPAQLAPLVRTYSTSTCPGEP